MRSRAVLLVSGKTVSRKKYHFYSFVTLITSDYTRTYNKSLYTYIRFLTPYWPLDIFNSVSVYTPANISL